MRITTGWCAAVALAASVGLSGCGGSPKQDTAKKKSDSSTPASTTPAAPTTSAAKTEPAGSPNAVAKDLTATVPGAPKHPDTPAAPKAPEVPKAPPPPEGPDAPMPGGKSISAWIQDLNSKDKDTVVEACHQLELGSHLPGVKSAKPKLEELSKSADAEIKEAAAAAVAAMK
ncbi:MAG: hypothetical protein HS116_16050 [Planctomycetes bacterium]|nr:hypothetical protein [Planctomycetota bacterium]